MFNKQLSCKTHPDEIAHLLQIGKGCSQLYCFECIKGKDISQFETINSLFSRINKKNQDDQQIKDDEIKYEQYSSILFAKEEILSSFVQHIESEKLRIDTIFDQIWIQLLNTFKELREGLKETLSATFKRLGDQFTTLDDLLMKEFSQLKITESMKNLNEIESAFAALTTHEECIRFLNLCYVEDTRAQSKSRIQIQSLFNTLRTTDRNLPIIDTEEIEKGLLSIVSYINSQKPAFRKPPNIELVWKEEDYKANDEGEIIKKTNCWRPIYSRQPIPSQNYTQSIRLVHPNGNGGFFFGICSPEAKNCEGDTSAQKDSFFIYNVSGFCINGEHISGTSFKYPCVVSIKTNIAKKRISFFVDSDEIAIPDKKFDFASKEYYLCILLYYDGGKIQQIEGNDLFVWHE